MKFRSSLPRHGGMRIAIPTLAAGLLLNTFQPAALAQPFRDTRPDTWVGADDLGRVLPGLAETGPLKPGKTVAMFYFLWLGAHDRGAGPYDISKILAQDPGAMQKPDSPLWGPLHAPHHWGQPHLGYYRSDDKFVLAKHAQMLADAGVDTLVFDVTNQATYRHEYRALLEVFTEVRKSGGRTPQVAFLCPFWSPQKVVRELYADLYSKNEFADLWFRLDGKPLILADPDLLANSSGGGTSGQVKPLAADSSQGENFTLTQSAAAVSACFATWKTEGAGVTLTLRRTDSPPDLPPALVRAFRDLRDNGWLELRPDKPLEPGAWTLEASGAVGKVGWWMRGDAAGELSEVATGDGKPVGGSRMFRAQFLDPEAAAIRQFFTFRTPQADYFRGPENPDMWSWLEVAPQHVFRNARGEPEMMSVGVAQNAVGGRLGSLSEAGARGRSFHDDARDTRPGTERLGPNFAEQWRHAREADPPIVFVTGWNEWIAGRFAEFAGVREPVMFVDQFNQENSRDLEPMRGGHGDDYYYQFMAEVRRFKGVRPPPSAGPEKTLANGPDFAPWTDVSPVFLDDAGDTRHRDHPGYGQHAPYTNNTGRNDILECRVARDAVIIWFYVKTADALSDPAGPDWMRLLLDTDGNPLTGWHGCEFRIHAGKLQRWADGQWSPVPGQEIKVILTGSEMQVTVSRATLSLPPGKSVRLNFKWQDNIPDTAAPPDWIDTGDTAPNGRLFYPFRAE